MSAAGELYDAALVAMGRLETAWEWLDDARWPGTPGPKVQRPHDPRKAEEVAYRFAQGRAAAIYSTRFGRVPSGTHPTPVRLGPVQVRGIIARHLTDLAVWSWDAAGLPAGMVLLARHPVGPRVYTRPCSWCGGSGTVLRPDAWLNDWPWPDDPPPCGRCFGRGRVLAGAGCPACSSTSCSCDADDLAVAISLGLVDELLARLDAEALAGAGAELAEMATLAERTCGVGPDRRRLPGAECPVCGSRELVPEVSNPDPRKWAIYCQGPDCLCQGVGCPCGIGTPRRRDRSHMWPASTWDGPNGLAARLGVALPNTAASTEAIEAIRRARHDRRRAREIADLEARRQRKTKGERG